MRREYIGDNLDMVKRIHLRDCRLPFKNLIVEPLITNEEPWQDMDFSVYADCLGVDVTQIRRGDNQPWTELHPARRTDWLQEHQSHHGDIFLDPDSGLDPPSGGNLRHVPTAAVQGLLAREIGAHRIVMVYQHMPQRTGAAIGQLATVVRNRVSAVRDQNRGIHAFAVLGQHATMIYFSGNRDRIGLVKEAFEWLGPTKRLLTF